MGPLVVFPNRFLGGPKVVKFVSFPSKLRKQPFFAEIFKFLPPSHTHANV